MIENFPHQEAPLKICYGNREYFITSKVLLVISRATTNKSH